eukprot:4101099-Pleurochrysis_carterae.AAC.1
MSKAKAHDVSKLSCGCVQHRPAGANLVHDLRSHVAAAEGHCVQQQLQGRLAHWSESWVLKREENVCLEYTSDSQVSASGPHAEVADAGFLTQVRNRSNTHSRQECSPALLLAQTAGECVSCGVGAALWCDDPRQSIGRMQRRPVGLHC